MLNWRRLFFENYKAKTALFLMAIFMWFFVVSSKQYVQTLRIPLRVVNIPRNRVLMQDLPARVDVRFRGRGTSLVLLSLFGDVHMNLDLSSPSYSYDYPLQLDQVDWAPAIEAQALDVVSPDTVYVRMDDRIQRRLKVKSLLTALPERNFIQVGPSHVMPDSVVASGAKSAVSKMEYALTQARTVEHVTDPLTIKLELAPSPGSRVVFEPAAVSVSIDVDRLAERDIPDVSVQVRGLPRGWEGLPDPAAVAVKIRGPASVLNKLKPDEIQAFAEADQQSPEGQGYPLSVQAPESVKVVEVRPASVDITLKKAGT